MSADSAAYRAQGPTVAVLGGHTSSMLLVEDLILVSHCLCLNQDLLDHEIPIYHHFSPSEDPNIKIKFQGEDKLFELDYP